MNNCLIKRFKNTSADKTIAIICVSYFKTNINLRQGVNYVKLIWCGLWSQQRCILL